MILVLHGIADSKASQSGRLLELARQRVVAVAPDLRAHGDSPGLASYGFHEKNDLAAIRRQLAAEHPGVPIGLWGTSYGAACGIQALAIDPGFDFAIVESTFADLLAMGRRQVANHTSLPLEWIAAPALRRAGQLAGFDPAAVSPEAAIARVVVPVLHLHGGADPVIPIEHGRRIAARAAGPGYRFGAIRNGDHFHLREGDPAAYDSEVSGFLERVLRR